MWVPSLFELMFATLLSSWASSGSGGGQGVWAVLDGWQADEEQGGLLGLVRRYSCPTSGQALVAKLLADARLAALELVARVLCGVSPAPCIYSPRLTTRPCRQRSQQSCHVSCLLACGGYNNRVWLAKGEQPVV